MRLLNDIFASTAVHSGERLSVIAMQQLAEIGAHAQQLFDGNRKLLNEFLDTRNDLEVVRPDFGTVMFPRVRDGSSEPLCRLLREKYETTVVPGSFFEMPAHFRVGIAGDTDVLEEGLKRLGSALDYLSRR
jgi:aspartate/methionine/tyrosine aminotransferase